MIAAAMTMTLETDRITTHPCLRRVPPPCHARSVLRVTPQRWLTRAVESMPGRALAPLLGGDALFFQRRLGLTGDNELGLPLRNVLDRLPWEEVPLSLRIVLNRMARLARAAHHGVA